MSIFISKAPHYAKKRRIKLISVLLILFLIFGLGVATFLIQKQQDLRQQAMIGREDIGDLSQFEEDQVLDDSIAGKLVKISNNLEEFTSEKGRYQLQFDPHVWEIRPIPDSVSEMDEDQSFFTHRSKQGFISVYFNSQKLSQLEIEFKSLDDLAEQFENKYIENQFSNYRGQIINYQGYDLVNIGGREAIKFNYLSSLFDQDVPYSEYVFVFEDTVVEAEVKNAGFLNFEFFLNQLIEGMTFSESELDSQGPAVKGAYSEGVAGENIIEGFSENKLVVLNNPSVIEIMVFYCKDLKVNMPGAPLIRSKYEYCNAGSGSGFIVGSDGLIATNAHVVQQHPEDDIVGGLFVGNVATYDFLVDFVRQDFYSQGFELNIEQSMQVLGAMINDPVVVESIIVLLYDLLEAGAIEVANVSSYIYANLGQDSFEINEEIQVLNRFNIDQFLKAKPSIVRAEIVDLDFANHLAKDVVFEEKKPVGSDVALIKLEIDNNYRFPALNIALDQSINTGDRVLVISYPGLVSGIGGESSGLIDSKSSGSQSTITTGVVSSLKNDLAGNKLIQTDAFFSPGSSGAPAFNYNGEVIGIATYGLVDDAGSYRFLIDIESLVRLAEKNNISLNHASEDTYINWKEGLSFFWDKRYTRSLNLLSLVKEQYPIHPTVEEYVVQAEAAIEAGQDIDLIFGINKQYVYSAFAVIGFLILIILSLIIIKFIKKKKRQQGDQVSVTNNQDAVLTNQNPVFQDVAANQNPVSTNQNPVSTNQNPASANQDVYNNNVDNQVNSEQTDGQVF
jgi:S1-C subfamily serine protease